MHIEDVMRKYLDMFNATQTVAEGTPEDPDEWDVFEGEILNALLRSGDLTELYQNYGMDDTLSAVQYEAERSTEAEEQSVESSIKRIKHDLARSSGEVDESK